MHGVKICLKTAWLTTAFSILLVGITLCASADEVCFQAGDTLLFLMFWLTFPTGLLFVGIATLCLGADSIHSQSELITTWLVMTCGGLLQWFVLVPLLFAKRELVTLNLRVASPVESGIQVAPEMTEPLTASKEATKSQLSAGTSHSQSAKIKRANKSRRRPNRSFLGFDNKGRSPLERVIDRL